MNRRKVGDIRNGREVPIEPVVSIGIAEADDIWLENHLLHTARTSYIWLRAYFTSMLSAGVDGQPSDRNQPPSTLQEADAGQTAC